VGLAVGLLALAHLLQCQVNRIGSDRLLADGRASSGDCALLVGSGGGLAYAVQVVTPP
jgi:hypothetical protein